MRNIYLFFSEMHSSRSRNEVLKRVIDFSKIAKPEEFEIFLQIMSSQGSTLEAGSWSDSR